MFSISQNNIKIFHVLSDFQQVLQFIIKKIALDFFAEYKKCPGLRLDLKMLNHILSSIYWHVDKNFEIEIIEKETNFKNWFAF